MIHCVWYPSGGFGHFVNSILNLYGHNFVRPKNQLTFSDNGDSHSLDYVAPKYFQNQEFYNFEFDSKQNYSLIVDNGINNENTNFIKFFPNSKIIKICYSDWSWPIVANTMIVKALNAKLDFALPIDPGWETSEPWAQREKYFLFLRDHSLRHAWRPDNLSLPLSVDDLLDYQKMCSSLSTLGVKFSDFKDVWQQWFNTNQCYFNPVLQSSQMLQGTWYNLTSLWDQAIFYYQIWCAYGVEVPHNQFMNFFQTQQEYRAWLETVL